MTMSPADLAKRRRRLKFFNSAVCALGVLVSIYAYVVETRFEHDPKYQPMCDISPHVSCTKAFNSRYGKGLGLVQRFVGADSVLVQPNSVYGVLHYSLVFVSGMLEGKPWKMVHLGLCALATVMSFYLAYILYLLRDICVVCVATYVCNFLLLAGSVSSWKLPAVRAKKKE